MAHEAATQYSPNAFAYNGRVALALVPAVMYLIGAGGNVSVYIITIGSMIAYLLDALRVREGALVAVWLTLLVVYFGLLFAGDIFNGIRPFSQSFLLYAIAGEVFFLVGLWGTLQVNIRSSSPPLRPEPSYGSITAPFSQLGNDPQGRSRTFSCCIVNEFVGGLILPNICHFTSLHHKRQALRLTRCDARFPSLVFRGGKARGKSKALFQGYPNSRD